jgi:hypothetical protein
MKKYKIAILDDHQNVALESADWSVNRFATCCWSRSTLTISGLRSNGAGRERHEKKGELRCVQ